MGKGSFRVDLTKIEGEGDFPCPRCGALISPDDETEEVYTIIDTIMEDDGCLESMVIRCNRCGSTISLDGLAELSEEDSSRIEISEALPESKFGDSTSHIISMDGKHLGHLNVEYAQKEDVEAFKKLRNLRLGEPFRCTVSVEDVEGTELEKEVLREIVKAVKRRFKGLRDGDIYIVEIRGGSKNFIGRASNL